MNNKPINIPPEGIWPDGGHLPFAAAPVGLRTGNLGNRWFEGGDSDLFEREPPFLRLTLPAVPPDNHLHATAVGRRYPTKQYQEWLRHCRPALTALLGDWEPPADRWWLVDLFFTMGVRGDAQNGLKWDRI